MKISEILTTAAAVYQNNGGYRGDDFFDREQADHGTPAMECRVSLPGAVNVAAGIGPGGVDWDFLARGGPDSAPVICHFSGGEVRLTASSDNGKGAETMPAVLNADEFTIAFQPNFLLEALAGVQTAEVILQMESSTKPALVLGRDDDSYKALAMSLRLS